MERKDAHRSWRGPLFALGLLLCGAGGGQAPAVAADVSAHGHENARAVGVDHARYTCPMHPEIRSPQPGSCPKCGKA